MKKRIISLMLICFVFLTAFSVVSFSVSADSTLGDFINFGLNEDFEKLAPGSDGWLKDYSRIVKDEASGNQYMTFDSQANEVHFVHSVSKVSGIVNVEVDYYNNNAEKSSFYIGLNGNNGLLYVTSNGGLRQGAANNWATFANIELQTWYTFRLVLDTDNSTYSMWYKKTGDSDFTQVTKNFVDNYYSASNLFKDGIDLIRMSVHASSAGNVVADKMRLDNVKIYALPHAYTKISSAGSADEMIEILNLYEEEGYLTLPENYEKIIGKDAIYASLKSKTYTSNAEVEEAIQSLVAGETIYLDMTPYYQADIIAKKGEVASSDSYAFGLARSKFTLDRADSKRDGYEGQGYNGELLSVLQNSDDIITLSRSGFDPIKVKIPKDVMSLGTNDTAIVSASGTKTNIEGLGDRYHKGKSIVISEFAGRKLSTVDVAGFATTVNHVWLCADVTYADGETVSYYQEARQPHLNGLFGSVCWRSEAVGKAVQLTDGVITDAVAITDPAPSDNVTPEDNYSNSYVSAQRFNLDPDRVIENFELYNSSIWGGSSVAILGITAVPSAKTTSLASESYDFESDSDGWNGGSVTVSPTAEWNKVYKTESSKTSGLLFANDISKYSAMDMRIYAKSDMKVNFADSGTALFEIKNGKVITDSFCDPALSENNTEKWVDIRFTKVGSDIIIYIKDGNSYFKINEVSVPDVVTGLEIEATSGDVYADDIKIQNLPELYACINDASSGTILKSILELVAEYEIVELPLSLSELPEETMENLISALSSGGYESDEEVKEEIENAVVNYLSDSVSDELFIYDYDYRYKRDELSGLSLVVNRDVASKGAVIYGAAYKDSKLVALVSQDVASDISKGTKIDIEDSLDISGADSYKFMFVDHDTMKPLCKNIDVGFKSDSVDSNYYPGWVRKTITFSYDDGNITTDTKALELLNDAGMKATFNLYSFYTNNTVKTYGKEGLKAIYEGHEIASHSKWHTSAIPLEHDYLNMPAYGDASASYGGQKGIYYYYANYPDLTSKQPRADDETYKKGITEGKEDLEKIFGEGSIRGFAYAYSRGSAYKSELWDFVNANHDYARDSGNVASRTGFALPTDWSNWNSTSYYNDLLTNGAKFAGLPDDGNLKFFCAGVHTADFNKNPGDGVHDSYWYQLEEFCSLYGNMPDTYWYATNIEIYDYVKALEELKITSNGIENNSPVDLYVMIDGKKAVVKAHSIYR